MVMDLEKVDSDMQFWKSSECNLAEYFYIIAKSNASNIAFRYDVESFTYSELNSTSNRIANYFLLAGVKSLDVVGIFNTKTFT